MYRKIAAIVLSLSFAVTACNSGGKKRVSLNRSQVGPVDAKATEGIKVMNKALSDSKCLRLDTYFTNLTALKEETILVYTSDVNIGTVDAVGGKETNLLAETDQKIRANAALITGTDPLVNPVAAQDIYSLATVTTFYVSAMDSKCKVAAIKGAGGNFDIVKSPADEILLQKQGNPEKTIRYNYERKSGKMTITMYSPINEAVCGKSNRYMMQKYVIARDQDAVKVELENGYAKMLGANVDPVPAELTTAVASASGRVSLPVASMTRVRQAIFSGKIQKPACP